jgi:alpha-1,6-mannosyltransferase
MSLKANPPNGVYASSFSPSLLSPLTLSPSQVSPFYHYLFPALPKLLHLTLPFTFFSLAIDRRTRRLITPCVGFIIIMSGLKHKEWRFIVYVVPAFFVAAAAGIVATGAM